MERQEEWRPVVGYEGYYEVSNCGRVRSVDRFIPCNGDASRAGYVRHIPGRVMRPTVDKIGRCWARFSRDDKKRARTVSTLVLEAFVGPRPPGTEGCHNDGDPSNNHVENLRWDTRRNNVLDAVRHGTHTWAKKTHCKRGHPFDAVNTYSTGDGRACRACRRVRYKARKDAERRGMGRAS